jgi:hypothetical protein
MGFFAKKRIIQEIKHDDEYIILKFTTGGSLKLREKKVEESLHLTSGDTIKFKTNKGKLKWLQKNGVRLSFE